MCGACKPTKAGMERHASKPRRRYEAFGEARDIVWNLLASNYGAKD